jgi:hypothetical protein
MKIQKKLGYQRKLKNVLSNIWSINKCIYKYFTFKAILVVKKNVNCSYIRLSSYKIKLFKEFLYE